MAPFADITVRSQRTPHDRACLEEDDPFRFDEQQLRYDGYDNEGQVRPSQWHTPDLSRHGISSLQQTSSYMLPVPPASSRPRLSYADTPVKDHNGPHIPNSGKLRRFSNSYKEPNLNLYCYQPSSSAASPNRSPASRNESQEGSTPTTSPFFNQENAVNCRLEGSINTSRMPVLGGIGLVSVHELPDRLQSLFPHPVFNHMQSRCFKLAYACDDNLVVSAPTASGKTTIFELAICRIITKMDITNVKIVYIGPTKSLCEERNEDWSNRFRHLGITCSLLTGDSNSNQQYNLKRSQLIVTTPEKWDSITRKWQDKDKLMKLVRLLLIDEIHILGEDRGATVEAVVTRMKSIGRSIRLVALSATVPNAADVAAWVGKSSKDSSTPAHLEVFGNEFRPCMLQKFVLPFAYRNDGHEFALDHQLNSRLPSIVEQHSIGKPIMVFCSTRNSTKATAKYLAETWKKASKKLWPGPRNIPCVQDEDLKTLLSSGIAYHHAGVHAEDRKRIEKAYLDGGLMIICCTSTLAVGVNLPCHLVIIKNTIKWTGGTVSEYSDLEIMQMLGRAGRPQFGDRGIGVILTRADKVAKYESMAEGKELLESHLHLKLIEHLNAEITLGTIRSLQDAKSWLASTFFFIRLQKNREYYLLGDLAWNASIDQELEHLCVTNISELRRHDMIEATAYSATEFGELMTKQYVPFKTMISFMNVAQGAKVNDILAILCSAEDFRDLKLERGKASLCKTCINTLDIGHAIYSQDKHAEKIALIIQLDLNGGAHPAGTNIKCSNSSLRSEALTVFSRLPRFQHLLRCLIECRRIRQDGISVGSALELSRSLSARAWDNTPLVMKQLRGVGPVTVRKLRDLGIKTFDDLRITPVELLDRCGKNTLFGTKLLSAAREFPSLRITASVQRKDAFDSHPGIYCRAEVGFVNATVPVTFNKKRVSLNLVILRSDGHLVLYKHIQDVDRPSEMVMFFSAELEEHKQKIICQVSCDEIAGTLQEAIIDPDIPAHMFVSCKKTETFRSHVRVSPVIRAKSSRPSEVDEFTDDSLEVEDFLAAELEGFRPISSFQALADTANINHSKKHAVHRKAICLAPKGDIRVAMDSARQTKTKSITPGGQAGECRHPCKDKSKCRHSCCKRGLDQLPVKESAHSDEAYSNVNEKSRWKKPTSKTIKNTKSKFDNHRASNLPTKVTKPALVTKHSTSSLDKIYNSARSHTLPTALLARNLVTTTEQNMAPQDSAPCDFSTADGIDEGWSEDTAEPGIRTQSNVWPAEHLPSPGTTASQVPIDHRRRRPHQRLLDISSDSDLDGFQSQNPSYQIGAPCTSKRKTNNDVHGSSKKVCIEKQINHCISSAVSRQVSASPAFNDHTGGSAPISSPIETADISPQFAHDEVAEMSQEIAFYQPFKDTDKNEMDFMAQFEDCCEFID